VRVLGQLLLDQLAMSSLIASTRSMLSMNLPNLSEAASSITWPSTIRVVNFV
jgi:hypothetical protein